MNGYELTEMDIKLSEFHDGEHAHDNDGTHLIERHMMIRHSKITIKQSYRVN